MRRQFIGTLTLERIERSKSPAISIGSWANVLEMILSVLVVLSSLYCIPVVSFAPPSFSGTQSRSHNFQIFSSSNDELESMRRLLESSWNSDAMGEVPSDVNAGANEAYSAILSASDRGINIFFVDLLLPSYDVTQGSNLYDEVLSVEYCIALSTAFFATV